MKKFQFSLESVMDYKEQLLINIQNDVARVNQAIARIDDQEKQLNNRYQENQQNLHDKTSTGITPQMIAHYTRYGDALQKELKVIIRKKQVLLQEHERYLEKLKLMNMEVNSLEKLKEREYEQYRYDAAKKDERFIEEFVVYGRTTMQQ